MLKRSNWEKLTDVITPNTQFNHRPTVTASLPALLNSFVQNELFCFIDRALSRMRYSFTADASLCGTLWATCLVEKNLLVGNICRACLNSTIGAILVLHLHFSLRILCDYICSQKEPDFLWFNDHIAALRRKELFVFERFVEQFLETVAAVCMSARAFKSDCIV